MDYGKLLSRAWRIAWQWKVLWILGCMVNVSWLANLAVVRAMLRAQEYATAGVPAEAGRNAYLGACWSLFLPIVQLALWLIAQGALIAGVQHVAGGGSTSFALAWRRGVDRFWTTLGVAFLAVSPLVVVGILSFCAFSIMGIGLAVAGIYGSIGPLWWAVALVICAVVVTAAVVYLVFSYAVRAGVIEDMFWIEAFRRGWEILRKNLGPTLLLGLILLLVSLVTGLLIGAPTIAVQLSRLGSGQRVTLAETPAWAVVLTIGLGLTLGSIVQTCLSACWTLAYRQWSGMEQPTLPFSGGPYIIQT